MMDVTFEIDGQPFAKQRPRGTRNGRMYTPAPTVAYESIVRSHGNKHFDAPLEGPVRVEITAIFKPAKSWSEKKTRASIGAPHTQKPDLDNCEKAILDGLNRVAFADDSQVCELSSRKMWGLQAKTIVRVIAL
jgi:Holliday junction resolvase RusA-like endonuclease